MTTGPDRRYELHDEIAWRTVAEEFGCPRQDVIPVSVVKYMAEAILCLRKRFSMDDGRYYNAEAVDAELCELEGLREEIARLRDIQRNLTEECTILMRGVWPRTAQLVAQDLRAERAYSDKLKRALTEILAHWPKEIQDKYRVPEIAIEALALKRPGG